MDPIKWGGEPSTGDERKLDVSVVPQVLPRVKKETPNQERNDQRNYYLIHY